MSSSFFKFSLPKEQTSLSIHPLSHGQQALWTLYQIDPESPAYNLFITARIYASLEMEAFHRAWERIVERHSILRTSYTSQAGVPVQQIHARRNANIQVIDASGWSEDYLREQILIKADLPFNLETDSIIRIYLFKKSIQEYILLLTIHHIASDLWSAYVVLNDFPKFYLAEIERLPVENEESPEDLSYIKFIDWQNELLSSAKGDRLLHYWQKQLAGELPILALPTDYPRPLVKTNRGASHFLTLEQPLLQKLKEQDLASGASVFKILLAAFYVLLYRYTHQEDILVGVPMLGRSGKAFKKSIGYFANPTVMRAAISGELKFGELLSQVSEKLKEAQKHQDYPFALLVKQFQSQPDSSRSPLFQVSFALQQERWYKPQSTTALEKNFHLEPYYLKGQRGVASDLDVVVLEVKDSYQICWQYSTDLFDKTTITRMAGHFQTLLESIVANPSQSIAELPLLTEAERQQLLVEWNNTQTEYPQDQCIHQLFEAQVERTPDAIAVVLEDQHLTYKELNQRANQLAHYLRDLGVNPEVLVGICVERSPLMIVGILGILKAGSAYVPLDPAYPPERLAFVLEDAAVTVLLTQAQFVKGLSAHSAQVLCLDKDWKLIERQSQENLTPNVKANNLAYAIYTSGSTGKPKGVLVEHQGLCNLAIAEQNLFRVQLESRILQFASFSFDASVWEIFMALTAGATLVLATQDALMPGQSLLQLLHEQAITHVTFPPSVLAALPRAELPMLQTMIVAGEACSKNVVASWAPGRRFFNAYGPTEATVCATVSQCSSPEQKPLIGRPIANTQIYLLAPNFEPVPIGVTGELYIGGDGLARGYLNRPDLTDEKFIPNPFSNEPGSRLYKTGDLARYLPDGNIEFLGRIDNQVKIRGFRIELGEIESTISQHPSVKQTIVIATENNIGNKQLVAYIVPQPQAVPSSNELRNFLKQKLPDYMIPAAFIMLETFPLTPNGKIDTKALPKPETAHQQLAETFIPPQTATQKILASIWAEVLQLKQVGIHDNFFELGGDSILSIQIVSRCHQANLQLTPKDLFQHQTIAELAQIVTPITEITAEQGLVTGIIPLTPIQHWFVEQNLPEPNHFNQSFLFEISPDLKPELLQQVLQQLLLHHDALRLRLIPKSNTWQLLNASTEESEIFNVIDLSQIGQNEQIAAIENAANQLQTSLNLSDGPIIRVALFKLGNQQPNRLLIIIHHLAVDGVSWRILLEDLVTAYQQLSRGETIQLPAKTTSFQDWAVRLTEYAQTQTVAAELDYWLIQLNSQVSPLPVDYPSQKIENRLADTACISVSLSAEQTNFLLKEVHKAYNTQINDLLLTALVQTFARWTGQNSLLIDLEGHGREEIFTDSNLSKTVGWFTSVFPVLLKLEQPELTGKSLKAIKEQLRRIPQRGIGYGIIRYLNEDETKRQQLQQLPQAQVCFNYLGQFDQMLSIFPILGLAKESSGSPVSLKGNRSHLLEINGFVADGKLQLNWAYNTKIYKRDTIERLANDFIEILTNIISHCLFLEAFGYTPTDFPDAELTQAELDELVESLRPKTQIESIYPLSPMQEGMLFHTLYAPNSGAYFVQLVSTLKGNLNVSAFEKAWRRVVELHPILRTFFIWENRQHPLQVACKSVNLPWHTYDWRSLEEAQQQEHLEAFLQAERERGFELDKAPLMCCSLMQLTDDNYQFVWSHHHLLMDGWCLPIILQQVWDFYEAFNRGENLYLDAPLPYRNYIAWLQQQDKEVAQQFWREQLAGFTAPTPLMVDKLVGSLSQQQDIYDERGIKLSVKLTDTLKEFARQNHLTLNTLVQAAWALLLSRYSGESDVVFGATVSGRPPALLGVESMVGLFINTLPIRVQISPEAELLSWLKQLQVQQVEREQYFYSPLVEIQGLSDVPRNLTLFNNIVVFENYPIDSSLFQGQGSLEIQNIKSFEKTNYPLNFSVVPGAEFSIQISYDANRFDDDTVSRMLGHLQTLLSGIVAHPSGRICELLLLTEAEKHQLLVEWNNTFTEYPQNKCIHQLFEEQVECTPDAVAVVFEGEQLTYRELNVKANQLAHYLRSLGVKPEVLVGICVERSLEIIVGLLGILKAGGAYVPLDPAYPKERIVYMLDDSCLPVLLTQQKLVAFLPEHQARLVCLDTDWEEISVLPELPPISNVTSENLAYAIYTSGSTGKPKGVAIEHKSIVNYVLSIIDRLYIEAGSSFALVSTISADLGNTVLFPSLCTGGTLHILSWDTTVNSAAFTQYISENSIDYLKIVPSHLAALQNPANPQSVLPRKGLILGGEASQSNWVSNLLATQPECKIYNHYGPTETTVGVLTYRVDKNLPATPTLPLGYPLNNTQIYILDTHLNPVPIGIPGEIYVGGIAVARGYINRADLTAERFITNPFNGSRLYKTGDLARYLPDGNIEFKGRIDNQVRIRGFRVELKDIESALCQHPDVESAAVIFQQEQQSNKQLVAYVVPKQKRSPIISGMPRYKLPNNLYVAHLNKNETDYIYKEIFELQAYLRHGITVNEGDCIFDVGSNIGLFGLFMATICPQIQLCAFEPNPTVYKRLQANLSLYVPSSQSFNCGLSQAKTTAEFTFFPGFSLLSGFYADGKVEREVVKNFVSNQRNEDKSVVQDFLAQADDILEERFKAETFTAQLRTLSEIIKEQGIENIDLLKINVEKSELDVLKGIQEQDWGKIRQIILEVDVQENIQPIISLLEKHGYEYLVEQDIVLNNTELCYIYAIRPSRRGNLAREQSYKAHIQQVPIFDDSLISSSELENFIKEKLPEYMMPNAFVFLSDLPLTANGKIDRQALPAPNLYSEDKYVAPRTPIEEMLANIWESILSIDSVGIHNNFFELGGHSLLAIQIVSRIRETFEIDLPLSCLFEAPTIAGISQAITSAQETQTPEQAKTRPAIVPVSRNGSIPLSFPQAGMWYLEHSTAGICAGNSPLALKVIGSLSPVVLERSFNEIIRRHEILRTTFSIVEEQPVQIISPCLTIPLEVINLQHLPPQTRELEAQKILRQVMSHRFDLTIAPLIKTVLVQLSPQEHWLLILMHHIITDGWSDNILLEELTTLYNAFLAGKSSPLPDLPFQYADFAIWQRNYFNEEVLATHLSFWKQHLADLPTALDLLPAAETLQDSSHDPVHHVALPIELSDAIASFSQSRSVTPFIVLLTALNILLWKWSARTDILILSTMANRATPDLEKLIGCFINDLPMRTQLDRNQTGSSLVEQIKQMVSATLSHAIPPEKLWEPIWGNPIEVLRTVNLVLVPSMQWSSQSLRYNPLLVTSYREVWNEQFIPLELYVSYPQEKNQAIELFAGYSSKTFTAETINYFISSYQAILQKLVEQPEQQISEFI